MSSRLKLPYEVKDELYKIIDEKLSREEEGKPLIFRSAVFWEKKSIEYSNKYNLKKDTVNADMLKEYVKQRCRIYRKKMKKIEQNKKTKDTATSAAVSESTQTSPVFDGDALLDQIDQYRSEHESEFL